MPDVTSLSSPQLAALIRKCEAALFRGTSSHQDMLLLTEAERELLQREQAQLIEHLRASRGRFGDEERWFEHWGV
jgi:hypothetical protein